MSETYPELVGGLNLAIDSLRKGSPGTMQAFNGLAREALKRMNAADVRKFHKVVLGHWHAPLAHPWYWIGGSCSGTDAFDHGQGRHAEPQQVTWLIHPRHGEFARTEWTLHEGG